MCHLIEDKAYENIQLYDNIPRKSLVNRVFGKQQGSLKNIQI